MKRILSISFLGLFLGYCTTPKKPSQEDAVSETSPMKEKVDIYKSVKLTTDISKLSENEKQMIPLMIEVSKIMDELFWYEAYGKKDSLLASLTDPATKKYVYINYGPWDRLDDNKPFIEGVGPKPEGANFYPTDMTKEEFEAAGAARYGSDF